MNRARSRDSGRNDDSRGDTAGRNNNQQTDNAMPMPTASNAGESEPVEPLRQRDRLRSPKSRSRDRLDDHRRATARDAATRRRPCRPTIATAMREQRRAEAAPRRRRVRGRREVVAVRDEEDRREQRDDRLFDVETLDDVARRSRRAAARGPATTRAAGRGGHAAGEQQEPDAADRDQRGRDLRDLDRREASERGRAGDAIGTVTADDEVQHARRTRSRSAPIRRVRRRSAVASPADGHVTVPGCSADLRRRPARAHALARRDPLQQRPVGRSRAPCQSRACSSDAGFELDPRTAQPRHEHGREAAARVSTRSTLRPAVPQFA